MGFAARDERSGTQKAHIIRSDAEAVAVARAYAAEIAPEAVQRDADRRLPLAELESLARSGLLAITLPRSHGGPDVSYETLTQVFYEIGKADPAIAQVPQNHFVFVDALRHEGSDAQRAFLFPQVLAGARFGNALSERGTKTTSAKTTRLTRDPAGGFRLNGRKYYCTGAYTAQWIPVMALDEEDRLVIAYVERDAPGVTVDLDWTAMGQRATISGSAILDNVAVPEDRVIAHWKRYQAPQILGAAAQVIHAAIHVAVGAAALEDGLRFVRDRARPFGDAGVARAADEPHILHKAGELTARQHAAEALLRRAAQKLDAARGALDADSATAASIAVAEAKAFGGETAVHIASEVFALSGASATDAALGLDRHWRNARTHTLHDPIRWKYHHIGNHALNGTRPPNQGII